MVKTCTKKPEFWFAIIFSLMVLAIGYLIVFRLGSDRAQILATFVIGVGATLIAAVELFSARQRHHEATRRQRSEDFYKAPDIRIKHTPHRDGFSVSIENTGLSPASGLRVQLNYPKEISSTPTTNQIGQVSTGEKHVVLLQIRDKVLDKFMAEGKRTGIPRAHVLVEWRSPVDKEIKRSMVTAEDFLEVWRLRREHSRQVISQMETGLAALEDELENWPSEDDVEEAKSIRHKAQQLLHEA